MAKTPKKIAARRAKALNRQAELEQRLERARRDGAAEAEAKANRVLLQNALGEFLKLVDAAAPIPSPVIIAGGWFNEQTRVATELKFAMGSFRTIAMAIRDLQGVAVRREMKD